MDTPLISIFLGGASGLIVILVIQLWKKIKLTALTSLGLVLIFFPQAFGLERPHHFWNVVFDLVFSIIGAIFISHDIIRVMKRDRNRGGQESGT